MRDFDKQMEMVLYHSDEGDVSVDAYIMNDSLWITQKAMAELFGVDKSGISRHLKKIFESGELDEKVVVAKITTTSPHGAIPGKTQDKESMFYNLDAIISVGYRVNSIKATKFRIWATTVLKEYMTKGFVLDDDRLKQGKTAFGKDYFRELLERENVFTMEEFEKSVNAFLEFRQYKILKDNGRISHKQAMDKANAEYEIFNKTQPIESDFDKAVKKMIQEQN
jgi:hypothetical protein